MSKQRVFSVYNDFRTGLFCKISFFLAVILLALYIFLKTSVFFIAEKSTGLAKDVRVFSQSSQVEAFAAFSLLLFASAIIFLFFSYQFAKLAKIAEEIENGEECKEVD